jgi:hypothetical protein
MQEFCIEVSLSCSHLKIARVRHIAVTDYMEFKSIVLEWLPKA